MLSLPEKVESAVDVAVEVEGVVREVDDPMAVLADQIAAPRHVAPTAVHAGVGPEGGGFGPLREARPVAEDVLTGCPIPGWIAGIPSGPAPRREPHLDYAVEMPRIVVRHWHRVTLAARQGLAHVAGDEVALMGPCALVMARVAVDIGQEAVFVGMTRETGRTVHVVVVGGAVATVMSGLGVATLTDPVPWRGALRVSEVLRARQEHRNRRATGGLVEHVGAQQRQVISARASARIEHDLREVWIVANGTGEVSRASRHRMASDLVHRRGQARRVVARLAERFLLFGRHDGIDAVRRVALGAADGRVRARLVWRGRLCRGRAA